jgi:hypothetical protein
MDLPDLYGSGIDSETRLAAFLDVAPRLSRMQFWPLFLDTWSDCDDTWGRRRELLRWLRRYAPSHSFHTGANAAFLASLPRTFALWRGCDASRLRGRAWTLNRDVALGFACGHRNIRNPNPVLARATITEGGVYAALTDREESEVVVEPRRLRDVRVEDVREVVAE